MVYREENAGRSIPRKECTVFVLCKATTRHEIHLHSAFVRTNTNETTNTK